MKFYAHKGSSNENAFTTYNGQPTRTFMAFNSKKARDEYRDKIWAESNKEQNLIDCTRKFVEKWVGRDFYVAPNNEIYPDYDSYALDLEYQEMKEKGL